MAKRSRGARGKRASAGVGAPALPSWSPQDEHQWAAWEASTCGRCVGYFGGHCKVLLGGRARGISPQWVLAAAGPSCLQFKDRATYLSKRQKLNRKEVQLDLF